MTALLSELGDWSPWELDERWEFGGTSPWEPVGSFLWESVGNSGTRVKIFNLHNLLFQFLYQILEWA